MDRRMAAEMDRHITGNWGEDSIPRGAEELAMAEESAMEELGKANLTPQEYKLVVAVGLAAVECARAAVKAELAECEREAAAIAQEIAIGKSADEYYASGNADYIEGESE